jgi:acyl-CoA thioester hydrolase
MGAVEPPTLTCLETAVQPEWVDYNGHMNDAAYARVLSTATDALLTRLGVDADRRAREGYAVYTLETHIRYLQEVHEAQPLTVAACLVDHDAKRLHVLLTLHGPAATAAATGELMLMGMDTAAGRPAPFPESVARAVDALWASHGCAQPPAEAGRAIGIRR